VDIISDCVLATIVALSPLYLVSSLEELVVDIVAESCSALLRCCYHPTQDLGGSSMRGYKHRSRGCCSLGSCSHSWLVHCGKMNNCHPIHHW